MKFFAVFLLCFLACGSPINGGLIDGKIKDEIEAIRKQMPYGFPSLGIPPLAPLDVKQKSVNVDWKNLNGNAEIDNLIVSGLNEFDIKKVKLSVFTKKFEIKLVFPQITINTGYQLDSVVKTHNTATNVSGSGTGDVDVKQLDVTVTGKASFSLFSGKAQLKTLNVVIKSSDIVSDVQGLLINGKENPKVNSVVNNDLDNLLNDNQKLITQFIGTVGLKKINAFLEDKNVLDLMSEDSVIYQSLVQMSDD